MDNIAIFQLVLASVLGYGLIGLTMWLFRTKDNNKEKLENPKDLNSGEIKT